MNLEDYEILNGVNIQQKASLERNEKTIDYTSSKKLTYVDILNIKKGLDVISEFYDVSAVSLISNTNIVAVALEKTLNEALIKAIEANPIEFINSYIFSSKEVDSDFVKMLKDTNCIVAPAFTKNAVEYLEMHEICYITIKTPLKDYKQYLQNEVLNTPLGTLTQTPDLSELNKETFKVATKLKPTVEQIEDAVFAWKVAKHARTHAVVVAKDLKTSAINQGNNINSVEQALDFSCELAKESILASDTELCVHDINAAVQCRISLIILPFASNEIIALADKYNVSIITTGINNILY